MIYVKHHTVTISYTVVEEVLLEAGNELSISKQGICWGVYLRAIALREWRQRAVQRRQGLQ